MALMQVKLVLLPEVLTLEHLGGDGETPESDLRFRPLTAAVRELAEIRWCARVPEPATAVAP